VNFAISLKVKKITTILTIFVLFLILAGTISEFHEYLNNPILSSEWFTDLFNLDSEFNLPALYASLSLLLCAQLLWIVTAIKKQERDRYFLYWRNLSFIFLFLSADEAFSIHEALIIPAVREALNLSPIFYQTWVIPGIILVSIFVWKYLKFLRYLPRSTCRLFILAGTLYVGGALGMEMAGGVYFDLYDKTVIPGIGVIVEEALEKFGIVVFVYALLTYLSNLTDGLTIDVQFAQSPRRFDPSNCL
jgi:hypothetical protein